MPIPSLVLEVSHDAASLIQIDERIPTFRTSDKDTALQGRRFGKLGMIDQIERRKLSNCDGESTVCILAVRTRTL
jgi:hypothetical protein